MVGEHEIESLMKTAMTSIKEMVDVNIVVGDIVVTADGTSIIPVTKVSCGFVAGGGEYGANNKTVNEIPFGGGSGAGVSVNPVAFLVMQNQQVKLIPVNGNVLVDRIIDATPNLLNQIQGMLKKTE